MKRLLTLYFFLFSFHFSIAQSFGGNPSSIKWKQINTDTFRIIFPAGTELKAQRVAVISSKLQREQQQTIGDKIRKINIVLQEQTLQSNGYVGLAPFRSELYPTPDQNAFELSATDPLDNLAIHEYRHVQQYANFNKGLSGIAGFFFGQQGLAVANAAAIPDWFFEGDAVFNETKFSRQGRGTLPLFMNSYQRLSNAGIHYSYMKMRNGSLRNYVPGHYELGYLLVTYGRQKYGEDIWKKVTDDASRFKPLFYPFQGSVKKHTGISYTQFVDDAMKHFEKQWLMNNEDHPVWLTKTVRNNVMNYKYPYRSEDGSLIVLKNTKKDIPAFYKIGKDGSEERISVKSISDDDYFSYNNGKIVYAAFEPDPRWGNRDFHSIQILDIQSKEEFKLLSRTKLFSPDISHNGSNIVAVNTINDTAHLVLINTTDGTQKNIENGTGLVFSYPKFSKDDRAVFWAVRNKKGEMSMSKRSIDGGNAEQLLPFSNRVIGFLNMQGDTLLFSSSYQGRDEVWGMIIGSDKKGPYRLASYSSGIYQAAFQTDGQLIGSAFTADGYRLGKFETKWERVALLDELIPLYSNAFQSKEHSFLDDIPKGNYPVKDYLKSSHVFNFHSWRPYYEQPEYSFTVYGQNVLNTFQTEIGYTFNENEQSHKLGFNGIYGGTYLQPVLGISQTWDRTGVLNKDTVVHWNEMVAYAGMQLPLNLTGGKFFRNLLISSTFNSNQVKWSGVAEKLFPNKTVNYLQSRISYLAQIQKSSQQIYPHWGQTITFQYKNAVNQYSANQFLVTGSLFLPGLMKNHSLVISAAYQSRDTLVQYLFSNNFPFARGYQAVDFPRMWKVGVNYHLPLTFPDWGIANLVYFLRIRSNLFFDYTEGKSVRTGIKYPFKTIGTELFFDTRWWNQQPVSIGIRYSRLLDNEFRGVTQPNIWEVILPVNLF